MKKKDLAVSPLAQQSQVLRHFILINMQRLVFRSVNFLMRKASKRKIYRVVETKNVLIRASVPQGAA